MSCKYSSQDRTGLYIMVFLILISVWGIRAQMTGLEKTCGSPQHTEKTDGS
jgi:hypothetical protein